MQALMFRLKLLEPVLAAKTQSEEPNSAITYPFIPGSMIRGALIKRYLGGQQADFSNEERQLFLSGAVRFLSAYPAHSQTDTRMLPKPLSWFVEKDEVDRLDAVLHDAALYGDDELPLEKPKAPRGEFYQRSTDSVRLGSPRVQVMVHNASDDRNRKDEGRSQVFRYEALAADEVFAGVIIADDAQAHLLTKIQPLLSHGMLSLGGSHTGGYGRVQVVDVSPTPISNWHEYSADERAENDEEPEYVIVTCLSDVIARDTNGQLDNDLRSWAGAKPSRIFRRMRLVGGFNRTWGLPLQQDWAIEAGSVFVFPASCKAKLEQHIESGIGDRRAEGFGRIAINLQLRRHYTRSEMRPRDLPAVKGSTLSVESERLARMMAERCLQADVNRALIAEISRLTGMGEQSKFRALPSRAQLSRARLAARQAWQKGDLSSIIQHFDGLSELTRRTWSNARMSNVSLMEWVRSQVKNKDKFKLVPDKPSIAGQVADWDALRERTLARLIEGVLKQAVKAKRDDERGEA